MFRVYIPFYPNCSVVGLQYWQQTSSYYDTSCRYCHSHRRSLNVILHGFIRSFFMGRPIAPTTIIKYSYVRETFGEWLYLMRNTVLCSSREHPELLNNYVPELFFETRQHSCQQIWHPLSIFSITTFSF